MATTYFVRDLTKGILGEPDSIEMWEQIINQIPTKVLMKKRVRILNVAFGHFTEADLLVKRMVELGRSAKDARDAICLVEKYSTFTNYARLRGYMNDQVYKQDFLMWAKQHQNMRFDIVIGNPPYQAPVKESTKSGSSHSLWPLFVEAGINLLAKDGYLVFVTPTDWRSIAIDGKRDTFADVRAVIAKTTPLAVFTRLDEKYFTLGQSIKIDAYILQLGRHDAETFVQDTMTGVSGHIAQQGLIPQCLTSELSLSILQKVASRGGDVLKIDVCSSTYGFTNTANTVAALEKGGDYVYPAATAAQMIGSAISKHKNGHWLRMKHPLHDVKKVMYTWNYGHFVIYDAGTKSPTNGIICIVVESDEQGQAVKDMLESKLFKFIVGLLHKDGDMRLPKYIATFFPNIKSPINLYKYFGLTAAEIKLVESSS